MLEQILSILQKEDTHKLFSGESHPSIFDAVSAISNPQDSKEIEKALKNYFGQVMQISQPTSEMYYEAERMYAMCDRIFASLEENKGPATETHEAKDMNDEIVDFYLESLKHFASGLSEDVLNEHIKYLENS